MQEPLATLQETPTTISLREYGDILRRRRAIILQTFVIVLVIGILINLYTPPTYQTKARLLLPAPSFSINAISSTDPLADMFQVNQQYSLLTQVQMLQSPVLIQTAAEDSHLPKGTPFPSLSVQPVEGTQIIEVTAEGENPENITNATNSLLKAYREKVRADGVGRIEKVRKFAEKNQADALDKVNGLEGEIRAFKDNRKILELDKYKADLMQEVASYAFGYQQAKLGFKQLQVRMGKTREQMVLAGKTTNPVVSLVADPKLQQMDDQIAVLNTQLQSALVDYPEGSIAVRRITEQIHELGGRRTELRQTFEQRNEIKNPIYDNLASKLIDQTIEASTQAQQILDLGAELNDARARLKQVPDWERKWTKLQRDYQAAMGQYTYFSSKLGDLQLRGSADRPLPEPMQYAAQPNRPIRPNREQNILFAGLLGIFFGLCLALLQELFDDRINSPEEAERTLRIPSLGLIPLVEEEGLRLIRETHPFHPLMESYRTLRTNINFAAVGKEGETHTEVKSLVVTSSMPAEGKSTTVANLAMAMALDNKRVIIVDADLRRPSLYKLFKIESTPGLTDVLVGTHQLDEVIRPTGVENITIIPAGTPPPNPAELLGSATMGHLLPELESRADIVLFDTPPVLRCTDGVVLASRTNGALLVVGYGETKKAYARRALEILGRANANVLGTVLNRFEASTNGYYGYGYGYGYYGAITDRGTEGSRAAATSGQEKALPEARERSSRREGDED